MDQASLMQMAQMLQAQSGQQPPTALPPSPGGLSELMRQNFAARGPGPVMENNHAAPPQMAQRPNDPLAPAYQGAADAMIGMSPPAVAYGAGQAIGDMAQDQSAGNAGALAMALFPGLRGGRLSQMLRGKFGKGEPAPKTVDGMQDPVGWYLNERAQGRTPTNDPVISRVDSATPIRPGAGTKTPSPGEGLPAGAELAPEAQIGKTKASYARFGSPELNDVRGAHMESIRANDGIPPDPRAFNKLVQGQFDGVPNVTKRTQLSNDKYTQFESDMGRAPRSDKEFNEYIYAKGKDGSIPKGTLGLAGMLAGGAMMADDATASSPDVHPKFKDRNSAGQFISQP